MARVPTSRGRPSDFAASVTAFALALALGLVLARCMMLESLLDPQPLPGQEIVLRPPGALVTSVLDLLSFLPAILLAGRALFDERFKLRWPLSIALLGLLAIWAMLSMTWAADRFSAAVSAGRLLGGAAIAWAIVQSVRDWKAFRIIVAVVCALLAVLLVHSLVYQFYELPETLRTFQANKAQLLAQQGIEEGTFRAQQFEQKLTAAELMAFYASPNSLAATAALISVMVVASLWQRRRDGGQAAWFLPGIILLLGTAWIVWQTHSNAASVTPLFGVGLLLIGWRLRDWISQHRGKVFTGGVLVLLVGWAALIGHGLYRGNLVQRSLTFRWQYWTASARLLKDHLLLGTGWGNFGDYYLQYRLPAAPEEIRDPHNLFVRFATELGIIGLALALGWLLRLAWEVTRPMPRAAVEPAPQWESPQEPLKAIAPLVWIALIATVVTTIAAVDFSQDAWHALTEVMRQAMYGLLLVGTAAVFAAADLQRPKLERRRADLLLLGVICGLAIFLLHNFIDFSLFETGLFYLFVTLAAAAVAVRMGEEKGEGRGGLVMLGGWLLLAAGFGVVVVVPAVRGDLASHRGDLLYADRRPGQAQQEYAAAFEASAWLANEDYLIRQSKAQIEVEDSPSNVLATLDQAIRANPRSIPARMGRVSALARMNQAEAVTAELQKACALSPNDVGIRLDAAEYLARLGQGDLAREQYQLAMESNAKLPEGEPKRLSAAQVAIVEAKIAALRGKR